MSRGTPNRRLSTVMALLLAIGPAVPAAPLGSAFTYQGRLAVAGQPANGSYDFEFELFDALTAGNSVGSMPALTSVTVTGGLFTVTLDFGAGAFNGQQRWLEIRVQPAGGGGYTALTPRQEMTAAPNALYAVTATTVNGLSCADGEVPKWNSGAWACGADAAGSGTVTSVATGVGLTGGPITTSGTLAVDFGGSGAAGTASRTDHDHLAQTWVGTGTGLIVNTTGIIGLAGRATAPTGDPVGVRGQSDSSSGAGVYGVATGTTGFGYGVQGVANSSDSRGVFGSNNATTGVAYGVFGSTASSTGIGVSGSAIPTTGVSTGVSGSSPSTAGRGVNGLTTATSGTTFGVRGQANSTTGRGVYGFASATTGPNYGVYGQTNSTDGYAGYFSGRVTVDGPFQIPAGAATGNVLTSDPTGNATWQPPVGTVSSVTAGAGLTGGAITTSGTIAVDFGGSGSAATVARGDHDHFGQTWSNSGVLGLKVESTSTSANVIWANSAATSGGSAGVYGSTESNSGFGVYGDGRATNGPSYGVFGRTLSSTGFGVFGVAPSVAGPNYGVYGRSASSQGAGVYGHAQATSGTNYGVFGHTESSVGRGVYGYAAATNGGGVGVIGETLSGGGRGVVGSALAGGGGTGYGVYGESASHNGAGVYGRNTATLAPSYGVVGASDSPTGYGVRGLDLGGGGGGGGVIGTSGSGKGVYGHSIAGHGVYGQYTASTSSPGGAGVFGIASTTVDFVSAYGVHGQKTSLGGAGVFGEGPGLGVWGEGSTGVWGVGSNYGVHGDSDSPIGYGGYFTSLNVGVRGTSSGTSGSAAGVYGWSSSTLEGFGVYGASSGTSGSSAGVYGIVTNSLASGSAGVWGVQGPSANAWAGWFSGRVNVTGFLSKSGGGFKIDHPLDPENRYLNHSFVESPDMKNLYDGVVTTDANGLATVELPVWFEALNRDFRYQLTVLDEANEAVFVQAKVVRKVANGRFTIRTSMPGVEVSWQVTGTRKDAWAVANPMPVEEDKRAEEQGSYLVPEAFGQPSEKGHDFKRRRALDEHRDKAPPATRPRSPGSN